MYAKLVFSIPVNNFYFYSIPDELASRIDIGKRVRVNFNNRDTYGYVIGKEKKLEKDIASKEIKPVLDIIDEKPVFNKNILKLGSWISSYYFASLGETLKIMTPAVAKSQQYVFDKPEQEYKKVVLTEKQHEIFSSLKELSLPEYALIFGITSSGKTEIYLSLMEYFIKKKSR